MLLWGVGGAHGLPAFPVPAGERRRGGGRSEGVCLNLWVKASSPFVYHCFNTNVGLSLHLQWYRFTVPVFFHMHGPNPPTPLPPNLTPTCEKGTTLLTQQMDILG